MTTRSFVVCIHNDGYHVSLEVRKLYEKLSDASAAKLGQVRIVDESGEDYLYPESFFAPVELFSQVQRLVIKAA